MYLALWTMSFLRLSFSTTPSFLLRSFRRRKNLARLYASIIWRSISGLWRRRMFVTRWIGLGFRSSSNPWTSLNTFSAPSMNDRSSGEGMIAPPRLLSCIHREVFVASLVLVPIHLCMPLVILTRNPAHQCMPSCSGVLENIEGSDGIWSEHLNKITMFSSYYWPFF